MIGKNESRGSYLLTEKKANIAQRLRRICGHLSSAEFDFLVERMALIDIKYSVRRTDEFFDPDQPQSAR